MSDELLDVVDDLTVPKPVKVPTDDGHTWATEDALLVQLEQAVSSSMNSGSGAGGSAWTRNVLDSAALHQATTITATIGDWCRMGGVKVTRDPVADLRAWYVARLTAPPAKREADGFYIDQMRAWAGQIRVMVLPPHRPLEVVGATCPDATEPTFDDAGDPIPHRIRGWIDDHQPRLRCTCGREWVGWVAARALRYEIDEQETA